jgi:hypothetical protein
VASRIHMSWWTGPGSVGAAFRRTKRNLHRPERYGRGQHQDKGPVCGARCGPGPRKAPVKPLGKDPGILCHHSRDLAPSWPRCLRNAWLSAVRGFTGQSRAGAWAAARTRLALVLVERSPWNIYSRHKGWSGEQTATQQALIWIADVCLQMTHLTHCSYVDSKPLPPIP